MREKGCVVALEAKVILTHKARLKKSYTCPEPLPYAVLGRHAPLRLVPRSDDRGAKA